MGVFPFEPKLEDISIEDMSLILNVSYFPNGPMSTSSTSGFTILMSLIKMNVLFSFVFFWVNTYVSVLWWFPHNVES